MACLLRLRCSPNRPDFSVTMSRILNNMTTKKQINRHQAKLSKRLIGYTDVPIAKWDSFECFNLVHHQNDVSRDPLVYDLPVTYGDLRNALKSGLDVLMDPLSADELWNALADDFEARLPLNIQILPDGVLVEPTFCSAECFQHQCDGAIVGYFAPDPETGVATNGRGDRLLAGLCGQPVTGIDGGVLQAATIPVSLTELQGQLDEGFTIRCDALASWRIGNLKQRRSECSIVEQPDQD